MPFAPASCRRTRHQIFLVGLGLIRPPWGSCKNAPLHWCNATRAAIHTCITHVGGIRTGLLQRPVRSEFGRCVWVATLLFATKTLNGVCTPWRVCNHALHLEKWLVVSKRRVAEHIHPHYTILNKNSWNFSICHVGSLATWTCQQRSTTMPQEGQVCTCYQISLQPMQNWMLWFMSMDFCGVLHEHNNKNTFWNNKHWFIPNISCKAQILQCNIMKWTTCTTT